MAGTGAQDAGLINKLLEAAGAAAGLLTPHVDGRSGGARKEESGGGPTRQGGLRRAAISLAPTSTE